MIRRTPLAATLLAVTSFYFWTASGGMPFGIGEPQNGYYNLLTDALLHGQLHLRIEPRPELFELAEPYAARQNERYRLQDASLYGGKYYLYFGVAPAVTLFAPWRLLGLGELPQSLAVAFCSTGGLLFGWLLLRPLVPVAAERASQVSRAPAARPWAWAGAALVLGFANVAPFVVRRPSAYEVAVSAGLCFLTGSAWLLLTAFKGGAQAPALGRLALGGLFLGLAVGSRPNHVFAVPFVLLLAWPLARARKRILPLLALLAPLAAVLFLLGLYNRARFDAWTEFGMSYPLTGTHVPFLDLPAFLPALYFHFFGPPALRMEFPFVFPSDRYPWTAPPGFFNEPTIGLLWHSPFVLGLFLAPWLWRGSGTTPSPWQRPRLLLLTALGIANPLLTNLAFPAVAFRYQMDFATFLAVPALSLWLFVDLSASGRARRAVRAVALLSMAWTCMAMGAVSLTGVDSDTLRLRNPALFAALEHRFEPLRIALGRVFLLGGRTVVHFRAALPERLSADQEPLLSSGTIERHDILWLRSVSPGRWALALTTGAGERQIAPPFALQPRGFHAFEVELDRVARRTMVRIDGARVAALRGALEPVNDRTLALGRGPRGRGAPELAPFSGSLLSERLLSAAPPGLEALPPVSGRPAIHTDAADPPPANAELGQLWISAQKDGASIFSRTGWRWTPRAGLDRVLFERRVSFAKRAPGTIEPIVFSGGEAAADAVFVRHLPGGRLAFGYARWNGTWSLGPTGAAQPRPDRLQLLRVTLDRPADLVIVELGGDEVLRASGPLVPLSPAGLRVGQSWTSIPLGTGSFSGLLLAAAPDEPRSRR